MRAASIDRWMQSYVPMISAYARSLVPQLPETWHTDELIVDMKDGQRMKFKGGMERNLDYSWNVMGRKTKFLIVSRLSKNRHMGGGDAAFHVAIRNVNGSEPERIITDLLREYREAISLRPHGRKPEHIKGGIKKPHADNNRMNRTNGTSRERVKIQKGWKRTKTPIAEGQRIHYNFVKPHIAVDGQKPPLRTGITEISYKTNGSDCSNKL